MRRTVAALIFLVVGTVHASAQTPNFVKTTTKNASGDAVVTTYTDGLGRELQTRLDLDNTRGRVVGNVYDNAGRLVRTTVPFVNILGGYYSDDVIDKALRERGTEAEASDGGALAFCYSSITYKSDPLGRIAETGAPGYAYSAWFRPSRFWYCATTANAQGQIDGSSFVAAGSLTDAALNTLEANTDEKTHFLNIVKDPNLSYSQEIKDVFGRTVATCAMNGAMAAYKYDILGNLLEEIPPHAALDRTTDPARKTVYRYNTLGQVTEKTSPDGGTVKYIYDKAGRLLYSQNSRQNWAQLDPANYTVYLYDELGRNYLIGINDGTNGTDFGDMDPANPPAADPNKIIPKIRSVFDGVEGTAGILAYADGVGLGTLRNLKGRVVASIAYDESGISAPSHPNFWNHVVVDLFSYDDEGRVETKYRRVPIMHTFCKHEYIYNMQNQLEREKFFDEYDQIVQWKHKWSRYYHYDRFGRLFQIAGTDQRPIVEYKFDDYGRMSSKYLYNKQNVLPFENVKYHHNIRDWVTKIESINLGMFTEEIKYATAPIPQYNGNIGYASFDQKVGAASDVQDNTYSYDAVNRLVAVASNMPDFNETFSYKKDGRINTKSKGTSASGIYQYYENTNRLNRIDGSPTKSGNNNFYYDPNGNLILDCSKNMVIEYDWRDMPVAFRFYTKIDDEARFASWTPDDWEEEITLNGGVLLSEVKMAYDAGGNRVMKTEIKYRE